MQWVDVLHDNISLYKNKINEYFFCIQYVKVFFKFYVYVSIVFLSI